MTIDQAINLLVTVTLIEMMVAIGLGVSWSELIAGVCNYRLMIGALLANYVCVPLTTVGLLLLFQSQPMVAAGFLMLAVCPGAPFIPPIVALAKGNVAVAVGMMAALAASSAVMAPLLLSVLLPFFAGDELLVIDSRRLMLTLLLTQLAPLCLGLSIRHWMPVWAIRLQPSANFASKLLNVLSLAAILATQYSQLAKIQLRDLVGMTMLLSVSLTIGWVLGGRRRDLRRTMALIAAIRNVGVSLVIATASFPGTPAVIAVLAYGLFGIVGSSVVAAWWGSKSTAIAQQDDFERLRDLAG